jgi:flagellar biosynthetic protein FliQ
MTFEFAIDLVRRAIWLAMTVAAPLLLVALLVGVVVSLIQAVTQIQEQTLTFIPKVVALGAVFLIALPWILTKLIEYLIGTIQNFGALAG